MNKELPPTRKETLKAFSIVVALTLSFNLISANISHLSLTSLRFFGFILFIVAFLALFPFSSFQFTFPKIREKNETLACIVILISSLLLFAFSNRVYWMLSFGLLVFGLTMLPSKMEKELSAILAGTLFYVVVFLLYLYNPLIYKGVSFISVSYTELLAKAIDTPMSLGPTPSGFWIWFYFVLCTVPLIISNLKKLSLRFSLSVVGLFILWTLSLILYVVFSRIKDLLLSITLLQLVLFFLLVPLFFFSIRLLEIQIKPRKWRIAALALLFLSTLFLTITPYFNHGAPGKIVFYQRDCAMGSYVPEFPKEGESLTADMGISFGTMWWYFRERGYEVEVLDDENSKSVGEALQDADVFVAANLNSPLSPEDCENIQAFVEKGGGLFIFGEHTNMMAKEVDFQAGRHYLNDILAFTGITVNTDTGEWPKKHWEMSMEFLPHQVVRGLRPEEIITGSVGASLSLSGSAQPVIVGRYAFSDEENPLEPGFLGDREYERGERMGDIILAASDTYGKGRILVFGDTSYGFNEALPETWRLMENSLDYLTDTERPDLTWITFLFFIVSVFLLYGSGTTIRAGAFAVLFGALLVSQVYSLRDVPRNPVESIAWIDVAHSNLLNTHGYKDNSVDGLTKNFMRNQYIPLFLDDTSLLKEGKVFVIIAPTRTYSSGEVKDVLAFVERGGLLILGVGFNEKYAVAPLLEALQMDVGDIPLGSVPWIIETHGAVPMVSEEDLEKYWHEPKFMEAYPVGGSEPFKSYASLTYLGSTYNLILGKTYGKGMVVLIGDSRFLLDENLEYSLEPARLGKPVYAALWVGNIELLKDVLTDFKEGLT